MFQLTVKDLDFFEITICDLKNVGQRRSAFSSLRIHRTRRGHAFSVLHSDRAIQVNIAIMRAFVQLRSMLATHEDLRRKISEMEKCYDSKFQAVFATLRQMLETPIPPRRQIGFHAKSKSVRIAKHPAI